MNRANLNKQKKPSTFDDELDLKLKALKNDSQTKSVIKNPFKRQIGIPVDEAFNDLQQSYHINLDKMVPTQPKHNKMFHEQIIEIEELQINQQSSILHRSKETKDNLVDKSSKKQNANPIGNHIWNLVSQSEAVGFLKSCFSKYKEQQAISIYDFIKQSVFYYIGVKVSEQQVYKIKENMKNDVTTTNPQILSLNALQILTKQISIQHYVMKSLIQARVKLKLSETDRRNKKIINGVTSKIDDIACKQQQLQSKHEQLLKRETIVTNKEKNLTMRQKQLIQRQKQNKKVFEDKCLKLYESYVTKISDIVKEAQKRLIQLEKNIKNKMELLQKKAQNMKSLINQQQEIKSKKISSQSQAKVKLRKLQKEVQTMQKKKKGEIEQFKNEQKDLLKIMSTLQEKISKGDKKVMKQKQKIQQMDNELRLITQKASKLQQENLSLNQALSQMKSKIPEENVLKGIKTKENTNRSGKVKNKKSITDIFSIIYTYQHILSSTSTLIEHENITTNSITDIMKQMLSLLISLLCSEEEDQSNQKKPHYLILFLNKIAIKQVNSAKNSLKEDKNNKNQEKINTIWSKQLSQLLQMPFDPLTSISLYLFLLPIINWHNSSAIKFFKVTIDQIIVDIEKRNNLMNTSSIFFKHQLNFASTEFLTYLIYQFIDSLSELLSQQSENKEMLANSLKLSTVVVDLLISISSIKQYKNNLQNPKIQKLLFSAFYCMTHCIIIIYSSDSKKENRRNEVIFTNFESIQQLSQKLSILIQRVVYQQTSSSLLQNQSRLLKKIYSQLQHINKSNGQRHSLILANLSSILSLVQQRK